MLCFKYISKLQGDFPAWFTGGKTTLIPKPGVVSSDNQRPITCLNTVYKWFTACLLRPMDQHLDVYGPKLNTVMKSARSAMQDIGLDWNPKKCSIVHIKRGVKVEDAESLAFDEASVIKCLEEGAQYKFLGVLESTRQEDQIAFKLAAEVQRPNSS